MRDQDAHLTVATLVERDGSWLFVEERINGALVINQPAGHWEHGETLVAAAVRETLEETAWHVRVEAITGIYEYQPAELPYTFLRIAFRATALRHDAERSLDTGIERALWMDPMRLAGCADRHRSPMVQRCVDDARAGRSLPLDTIAHL